ncbi:glycosyltransferase family 2 protein [Anaerosinus gibii]|uniref:Glycosyltransferase family 2 protein n=1 Tax=Selenobaculum gibii TaxID=3054208 RepID=A0A9Y2AJC4_9FIRM|nr:glycosyltransferase family 2 protein [Selenobaculum gbiensis]WIW71093.1 glycosyltransferase family 2 protein [Selenobaculum gbiensis]
MDKDKTLKITIITVSYNAAETIEQTILSVVNQTYDNIEYIIIDGGSTDGTVDIIKKYEDQIAHWESEPDKGIYDAMNKGIDAAIGEYIYFIGADDELYDVNAIDKICRELLKFPRIDVCCGCVIAVDNKLKLQKNMGGHILKKDILCGIMTPHQGMFVKRTLLLKYKFNCDYKIAADFDVFIQLAIKNSIIHFSDIIVAKYNIGGYSSNFNLLYHEYEQILYKRSTIDSMRRFSVRKRKNLFKFKLECILPRRLVYFLKKMNGWKDRILVKR